MLFTVSLALVVLLILLLRYVLGGSDYWGERGVPTASGREWLFGHYKKVFFVKNHIAHLYVQLYKEKYCMPNDEFGQSILCQMKGTHALFEMPAVPVSGYYLMNVPALIVRDPEIIRSILITDFANFSSNGFSLDRRYDCLAGCNPFFLKDEEWKTSRGHATPALSVTKLKGYVPSMVKVAGEMVRYVRDCCKESGADLDLEHLLGTFATDVLGCAVCGVETNSFLDRDSLFAAIFDELTRTLATGVIDNAGQFAVAAVPGLNRILRVRLTTKKMEELLVSLTRKIIHDRTLSGEKRNDFYQVMMGKRENDDEGVFTDKYISSHVFTILLDLLETSRNTLMTALFTLAWHPEYQSKLRSKIIELKSKCDGEWTMEDIEKFKYLDMVLCESMRLYTPISVLSRECTKDYLLTVPGQKPLQIAKGTPVAIPIVGIHVDPKYYPVPEKFDPERFSDEEIAKRPKYTFMPFGEGPKKCLGMRIGTLLVKVGLIHMIQQFRLEPSAKTSYPLDIDPRNFLTSRPTQGAWVHFEKI